VEWSGEECLKFITLTALHSSAVLSSHLTGSRRGAWPPEKEDELSAEEQKAKSSAGQGFSR
jgi:hypothetical protein